MVGFSQGTPWSRRRPACFPKPHAIGPKRREGGAGGLSSHRRAEPGRRPWQSRGQSRLSIPRPSDFRSGLHPESPGKGRPGKDAPAFSRDVARDETPSLAAHLRHGLQASEEHKTRGHPEARDPESRANPRIAEFGFPEKASGGSGAPSRHAAHPPIPRVFGALATTRLHLSSARNTPRRSNRPRRRGDAFTTPGIPSRTLRSTDPLPCPGSSPDSVPWTFPPRAIVFLPAKEAKASFLLLHFWANKGEYAFREQPCSCRKILEIADSKSIQKWRRGWDLNPRYPTGIRHFQCRAFGHSATSPHVRRLTLLSV